MFPAHLLAFTFILENSRIRPKSRGGSRSNSPFFITAIVIGQWAHSFPQFFASFAFFPTLICPKSNCAHFWSVALGNCGHFLRDPFGSHHILLHAMPCPAYSLLSWVNICLSPVPLLANQWLMRLCQWDAGQGKLAPRFFAVLCGAVFSSGMNDKKRPEKTNSQLLNTRKGQAGKLGGTEQFGQEREVGRSQC